MCGLAYIAGNPPEHLAAAAIAGAAARGPHSWGWTWPEPDGSGTLNVEYGPGRLAIPNLRPTITRTGRAPAWLLGHSRLATSSARPGDRLDPTEGQPIIAGPIAVAHNGTIPWPVVDSRLAHRPIVDSAAIIAILECGEDPRRILSEAERPSAVLYALGGIVHAIRTPGAGEPAHPLWHLAGPDWTVLSSGHLPDATLIPEDESILLTTTAAA